MDAFGRKKISLS